VPFRLSAHEYSRPAMMAVTPVSPVTRVGINRSAVVPSPSRPLPFSPQQTTVRFCLTAHVCSEPALIAITPVSPDTWVAVNRLVVVLSPS
jgi:hypothetical protein